MQPHPATFRDPLDRGQQDRLDPYQRGPHRPAEGNNRPLPPDIPHTGPIWIGMGPKCPNRPLDEVLACQRPGAVHCIPEVHCIRDRAPTNPQGTWKTQGGVLSDHVTTTPAPPRRVDCCHTLDKAHTDLLRNNAASPAPLQPSHGRHPAYTSSKCTPRIKTRTPDWTGWGQGEPLSRAPKGGTPSLGGGTIPLCHCA